MSTDRKYLKMNEYREWKYFIKQSKIQEDPVFEGTYEFAY